MVNVKMLKSPLHLPKPVKFVLLVLFLYCSMPEGAHIVNLSFITIVRWAQATIATAKTQNLLTHEGGAFAYA